MSELIGLLILLGIAAGLLVLMVLVAIVGTALRPPRLTAAWAIARNLPVDPGDLGLDWEAWVVRRPDGVELPVWSITGDGGADAPVAVIAHGWCRSRISVLSRLEPFRRLASRVVLADARGHGEAAGRCTLGVREIDDLRAVVRAAADGRPVVLVGWSLGATAAIAAAAPPDAGEHDPADWPSVLGVLAHAPVADLDAALRGRLAEYEVPLVAARLIRTILRWAGAWPTPLAPGATDVPVVIVHGDADPICPIDGVRALTEALPQGSLIEVSEAGHASPEAQAGERYDTVIAALFAGPDRA